MLQLNPRDDGSDILVNALLLQAVGYVVFIWIGLTIVFDMYP